MRFIEKAFKTQSNCLKSNRKNNEKNNKYNKYFNDQNIMKNLQLSTNKKTNIN